MLSRCFLDFSVGVRASVIGLSQISSFSLVSNIHFCSRSIVLMHAVLCFHIRRPDLTEMIISANSRIQSK